MTNKLICLLALLTIGTVYAQSNIQVNEQAPPINITDWIENVPNDKSLNDKYIVLEFWATWCGPCIAAVPHMNGLQEKFSQKDLYYLSITDESVEKVERKLKRIDFKSVVVSDLSKQTQINFGDGVQGLDAYPLTVLIDKRGVIQWIGEPMDLDSSIMSTFLSGGHIEDAANYFENPVSEQVPKNRGSFKELLNNKDIRYYFELSETDDVKASKLVFGTSIMRLKGYRLEDIFMETLGVKKGQLEMPGNMEDRRFDMLYKNTEEPEHSDTLEKVLLEKLNLEKKTERKPTVVYMVSVRDQSLLEEALDSDFSARSDAGDKVILTASTINNALDELSNRSSTPFLLQEETNTKYDFVINTGSEADMVKSLKSYGLEVVEKYVELMYVTLIRTK